MSKAVTPDACGRIGCRNSAHVAVDHPIHGRLVTCWECARGYEVLDHV